MRIIWHISVVLVLLLIPGVSSQVQASPYAQDTQGTAPTYTVFATREGLVGKTTANGYVIQPNDHFVALPSFSVLCSHLGHEYQVRITYKGRSVIAPVWDVGPWNTNDDYWSPSRHYSDLPIGVPMAQAAYLEGYNGGLDESGRRISMPNGIDIADGTFWEDLDMTRNDWVQVSFLWLGEDPGPGNAANIVPPPTRGQQDIPAARPVADWVPHTTTNNQPAAIAPVVEEHAVIEEGMLGIDNSDGSYTTNDGPWFQSQCGVNGTHDWTYSTKDPGKSENYAVWRPAEPLHDGMYEIRAYIPACGGANATRSARYYMTHNGIVSEAIIDQKAAAGSWVSLGTYYFRADSPALVELHDLTGDSHQAVRFDAVAWVHDSETVPDDTTPPNAHITSLTRERTGFRIRWEGVDDISGIASYDVQVRRLPSGVWRDWLVDETRTDAWFGPDEGKQFAFRIRARDKAGNVQPWRDEADVDSMDVP